MDSSWNFFIPKSHDIYKINVFDDGYKAYEQFGNEWLVYGKWRGKSALVNKNNQAIKIFSISTWKITKIAPNPK